MSKSFLVWGWMRRKGLKATLTLIYIKYQTTFFLRLLYRKYNIDNYIFESNYPRVFSDILQTIIVNSDDEIIVNTYDEIILNTCEIYS